MVAQGKVVSYLNDYGTSGAKSKISKSKADNCVSMQDLANQMMGQMGAAGTQETEDNTISGGEATPLTYSGEAAKVDCAVCDQMPPAARNACLASC